MNPAAPATATLLALMRLGEQSAGLAFDRLSRSAALCAADPFRNLLAQVASDERRHERALAAVAGAGARLRMSHRTRRFFIGLRDRDIRVHLARIAALDGSVCQIITQVLSSALRAPIDATVRSTLDGIRLDEGRHVRIARCTALRFGASEGLLCEVNQTTREAFCSVLAEHAQDFEELGVNATALLRRLSRATP